jgi:hypothetical protein
MKLPLPILLFLICIIFIGCLNNFPEEELIEEINSGTYKVNGTQVELRYDFPWPSWGGEEVILSRDTTKIKFTIEIEYPEGKQDTVRFDGLVGANAGEHRSVFGGGCIFPECYADAKLTNSQLKFDLGAPSGAYTGLGYLKAETLILETNFEYRAIGIDYDLQGEKVED